MPYAHLIVCERKPCWAVAWRRALGRKLRVIETRTIAHCEQKLIAYSASIVAAEITGTKAAEWGMTMAGWRESYPDSLLIALGGEDLAPWELYLREAGTMDVVLSRRHIRTLAPLVLRHARKYPAEPPVWKQAIWPELPWSDITASVPDV